MRKDWLDNLRWMTVLIVLFYHVFYFYNNKGVLGGIGGFDADPMKQPQDIVLYVIYPWIMMLLFLLGYFVFSHEEVLQRVKKMWLPVSVCAIVAGVVLCIQQWGNSYASPEFLSHWLTCLYAWLMILAIMGIFMKYFDSKNSFCNYMTRNSFGFYILHYTVVVSFGYLLKMNTSLSPWVIYPALTGIVFCMTPILNEVISRIPIIRWMVLGKRKYE